MYVVDSKMRFTTLLSLAPIELCKKNNTDKQTNCVTQNNNKKPGERKDERSEHQNRNYKFMRLSLGWGLARSRKNVFTNFLLLISFIRLRLGAWDYEWTDAMRLAQYTCMCVDLIIFLFLSAEHLLLWLSAKLLCSGCVFLFIFAFRSCCGEVNEISKVFVVWLECEHSDSSCGDD